MPNRQIERMETFGEADKFKLPGWKIEKKYNNQILLGNWSEERRQFKRGSLPFGNSTNRQDFRHHQGFLPDKKIRREASLRNEGSFHITSWLGRYRIIFWNSGFLFYLFRNSLSLSNMSNFFSVGKLFSWWTVWNLNIIASCDFRNTFMGMFTNNVIKIFGFFDFLTSPPLFSICQQNCKTQTLCLVKIFTLRCI